VTGDEAESPGPRAARLPQVGGGLVGLFARHPTAANLLMMVMILVGVFALSRINTQFFPDFGIDVIQVSIEWPGATADDVDQTIVQAVEPEVRFLDSVKRVTSNSYEGLASISVAFESGADMQSALSQVESAVAQVTTLPEDAEQPTVRRIVRYDTISRLIISGPFPEYSLKAMAKTIRDDLLARGIDKVDIFGGREEEIWVEVSPGTLRQVDLTLNDISERIRTTSQDVPSGDIGNGERQIRSLGLLRDAAGIAGIEVKALEDGRKLKLSDIATVTDTFSDGGRTARRLGNPAIELHIQRAINADALELAAIVETYLNETIPTLPASLTVEQYDKTSQLIQDRVDLLLKNGVSGLVLVILILFAFLNGKLAFWVMLGIPVSLMATVAVMLLTGQTINMVSLFGLILAVGIIVDDAIVVGEHGEARARKGLTSLQASISGATRMAPPVLASSLTTVCAFLPLLVIQGVIGDIVSAIPLVVITVILASLIECFLVLPGHMRGSLNPRAGGDGLFARYRRWFDTGFFRFRDNTYRKVVLFSIRWRYATLACAFGAFLVCIGLLAGGRVGFTFFPSPEADKIYANVEMVAGSHRADTVAMLDELDRALAETVRDLDGPDSDLVRMTVQKVGTEVGSGAALRGVAASDTTGGLVVELKSSDQRDVRTEQLITAWRAAVQPLAGMDNLAIREARGGPPGRDVDVRLKGSDVRTLKEASNDVVALLDRVEGVSAVSDDLPWGKPETILEVTPRGRALDFTTESVGRQVRNAIEGAIAKRFPRGDEEVTVRVQFDRADVGAGILTDLFLRAPDGTEVPLTEIVSLRESQGFARIRREDGRRELSITGDVDKTVTNTDLVIEQLQREGLQEIASKHGVAFDFKGKAEEQQETFADMRLGAILGLILIYIVLAWVFASYTRPFAVMMAIPLGLIGAVVGHYLMGFNFTILSLVAFIGLSGIVINDSIVMVSTIDERRRTEPLLDAIVGGSCDRLRAVILTSTTTIGGLTPLMFETSQQAQFLIPMAVTITFGLAVATVLVLVVVPALVAFLEDVGALKRRLLGQGPKENPPEISPDPASQPGAALPGE